MNKKQLIEALAPFHDNMEVLIDITTFSGEFPFVPFSEVTCDVIGFSEEPGGKVLAKDKVIILSE